MKRNLKLLTNEFKKTADPDTRYGEPEFLKRNPPQFDESEEVRVSMWNHAVKFAYTLFRFDKGVGL